MFRHAHIAYSIDAYSILCDYTYVIVIIQFRGSIIVQVSVTVIQKTDFGCCQAVLEDGNFVQQSIKESIICLSLESWDEIQRLSSLFLYKNHKLGYTMVYRISPWTHTAITIVTFSCLGLYTIGELFYKLQGSWYTHWKAHAAVRQPRPDSVHAGSLELDWIGSLQVRVSSEQAVHRQWPIYRRSWQTQPGFFLGQENTKPHQARCQENTSRSLLVGLCSSSIVLHSSKACDHSTTRRQGHGDVNTTRLQWGVDPFQWVFVPVRGCLFTYWPYTEAVWY